MKNFKPAVLGVLTLIAVSCGQKAAIKGSLSQAPDSDVIVKLLDVNTYKVLDTIKTDAAGNFATKVDVKAGQPEFIYLFHGDTRIASLILMAGDKVSVVADTLGTYSVEGSEESAKLCEVETRHAAFLKKVIDILTPVGETEVTEDIRVQMNKDLSKEYVAYYKEAVKYILSNPCSLSDIPLLYQNVNGELPIFNQVTDAVYFRNVCDSLMTLYPDSKYVKALDKEAERRANLLNLNMRLRDTKTANFPDITLPDVTGKKVSLNDVDSKVILLYFWTSTNGGQKMLNLDELKPLYEKYHAKGLEIFAVSLDADKATWASTVKNQKLPWINVCDSQGASSPLITLYNLASLPSVYLISDGDLVSPDKVTSSEVSKAVASLLK